jgi:hypothetical protein
MYKRNLFGHKNIIFKQFIDFLNLYEYNWLPGLAIGLASRDMAIIAYGTTIRTSWIKIKY